MEFKKYNKIHQIGHKENITLFEDSNDDIYIEEKVDGANTRFYIKDGKIIFGSRTQEINEDEKNAKNFKRCLLFLREKIEKIPDIYTDLNDLIFYGEAMFKHSLDYNWEEIPLFLGFDVFDVQKDKFEDWDSKTGLFNHLELDTVPFIKTCKAGELKELSEDMIPESKYPAPSAKDRRAEGIVFKNYNKQVFGKLVRTAFKEVNKETFGMSKKFAKDDDERIVAMYCVNARIDKMIFKLIDEGVELEMKMMEQLPKRVYEDIMEEGHDILFSNYSVDFRNIRKLVTKRCLAVLQQVITNNALNVIR